MFYHKLTNIPTVKIQKEKIITIQTKITGQKGEDTAAEYLVKQGYKIIARNVHFSRNCEIDIIAQEKDTTVFVEVKTRSTLNFGHPFEAINQQKIQKIHIGILNYIKQNNIKKYRIDGIAVIGIKNPTIEHLKNLGYE